MLLRISLVLLLSGCAQEVNYNTITSSSNATLSWMPPVQNTDGSTLTDLAGYVIYYSTDISIWENNITISPGLTSYVVEPLAPGSYRFMMRAFNSSNILSPDSNIVTKEII